jgi:hypothetical protein
MTANWTLLDEWSVGSGDSHYCVDWCGERGDGRLAVGCGKENIVKVSILYNDFRFIDRMEGNGMW